MFLYYDIYVHKVSPSSRLPFLNYDSILYDRWSVSHEFLPRDLFLWVIEWVVLTIIEVPVLDSGMTLRCNLFLFSFLCELRCTGSTKPIKSFIQRSKTYLHTSIFNREFPPLLSQNFLLWHGTEVPCTLLTVKFPTLNISRLSQFFLLICVLLKGL